MTARITLPCLALVMAAGGTGCALPVIEGVFDAREFAVFDDTPEARGQSDDGVLLVFVDIDEAGGRLRTVSVDLHGLPGLPAGDEVDVGDGSWADRRPSVEVVEGSLVTEPLPEGGTLMTTGDDARRAVSEAGSLTLEENGDVIAGSFAVDLDDGGYLRGTFHSAR